MPIKINSVTISGDDNLTVFSEGGDLSFSRSADNMGALSVVVIGNPPPPPGEVVFTEGFEDFPGEWTEDKGYFQRGNSGAHKVPPPPEMGRFSLRMKVANGLPGGGEFPEFESDTLRRKIQLEPGLYRATQWIVTNENPSNMTFEIREGEQGLGGIYGTEGYDDDEWKPQSFAFETLTGGVEMIYTYTAPATTTDPSGMKIALLTIEALE